MTERNEVVYGRPRTKQESDVKEGGREGKLRQVEKELEWVELFLGLEQWDSRKRLKRKKGKNCPAGLRLRVWGGEGAGARI